MTVIGPRLEDPPDGARRYRVLWIDAQFLVTWFANMSRPDRRFTARGMPADARLIGQVFESFLNAKNEHRIGLLLESATFAPTPEGCRFPDLDLYVTEERV